MKTNYIFFTAALVLSLLAISCEREKDSIADFGKGISFRSTTEFTNGTETKTSYSGWISTGGKERIDWVGGDKIRIASAQANARYDSSLHSSDYSVSDITTGTGSEEYKSFASISPDGGNGLVWGSGTHQFYSVYPSPATTGMSSNIDITSSGSAGLTIPDSQSYSYTTKDSTITVGGVPQNIVKKILRPDMNYAYMYASAQAEPSASSVLLSFKPMFTAFEFTISCDDVAGHNSLTNPLIVTSFTISSASQAMSGSCSGIQLPSVSTSADANFSSATFPAATAANKLVSVSFNGGAGYEVTKDDPLTFTVFALPRDYNDLTISFTVKYGTETMTKSLPLQFNNGTWVSFAKCQKYRIKGLALPNDDWVYSFSELEPLTLTYKGAPTTPEAWVSDFRSYRTHMDGSLEQVVDYHLEYSTDGGTTWSTTKPTWITPNSPSSFAGLGGASTAGEDLTMNMAAQDLDDGLDVHTAYLRAQPDGSCDLSSKNGKGESVATSTANCYIVHAPGTYTFPLVYGNALFKGEINESAFHRTVSAAEITAALASKSITDVDAANNFLDYYLDHNGDPITNDGSTTGGSYDKNSIYIAERFSSKPLSAILIWEDAPDIVSDISIVGSGTGAKVQFKVPSATIQEGNALIAVTDGTNIVWSWQIWVSAEAYTTFQAQNGRLMATDNIGWVNGKRNFYPERSCMVKAVQDGGLTGNPVAVTQSLYEYYNPLGNSSYYQWGRKDPFPGCEGNPAASSKKAVYNNHPSYPSGAVGTGQEAPNVTQVTLQDAIRHPNYVYPTHLYDWCSTSYLNLWNSSLSRPFHSITEVRDFAVTKTIYDPSPAGFMVPTVAAFEGYSQDSFTFVDDLASLPPGYPQGVYIGTASSSNQKFMPVTGYIDRKDVAAATNGAPHDYVVHGVHSAEIYYWTSTPYYDGGESKTKAYELRYASGAADIVTNWTKSTGISIRPVEEILPYTRIYILEENMHGGWGSDRRLYVENNNNHATLDLAPGGTVTLGSHTYTYYDLPASFMPSSDTYLNLWNHKGDTDPQRCEIDIADNLSISLGHSYYFRTNGLEVLPVTDPANPPAFTKVRVYVTETIGSVHDALWNTGWTRKLRLNGSSGILFNAEMSGSTLKTKSFSGVSYCYFEFDLTGTDANSNSYSITSKPSEMLYRAYDGSNGKGYVYLSTADIQNGGEFFYHINAHHYTKVTDPNNPENPYAIVYVLDETNTSTWGSVRKVQLGTNEARPEAGTEIINGNTYKYFTIPSEENGELKYLNGEDQVIISFGTVNVNRPDEYFFRTNGRSVITVSDPANPGSLPVVTRIYVLDRINVTNHPSWNHPRYAYPSGGDANRSALRGTATIGGNEYEYFDITYTGSHRFVYYASDDGTSPSGSFSSGSSGSWADGKIRYESSINYDSGGEYYFITDGKVIYSVSDPANPPTLPTRLYVWEDGTNSVINNCWGTSRTIWVDYATDPATGEDINWTNTSSEVINGRTYKFIEITNATSLADNYAIYYKGENGCEIKFPEWEATISGGNKEVFYRTDGVHYKKVTTPTSPEAYTADSNVFFVVTGPDWSKPYGSTGQHVHMWNGSDSTTYPGNGPSTYWDSSAKLYGFYWKYVSILSGGITSVIFNDVRDSNDIPNTTYFKTDDITFSLTTSSRYYLISWDGNKNGENHQSYTDLTPAP